MGHFGEFLKTCALWSNSVTRQVNFNRPKIGRKCQTGQFWQDFFKPEACGQIVLPDRSILVGQKLVKNAKIKKLKCDIFRGDFQTCDYLLSLLVKAKMGL